jgi:hypothetical protein
LCRQGTGRQDEQQRQKSKLDLRTHRDFHRTSSANSYQTVIVVFFAIIALVLSYHDGALSIAPMQA